MLYKQATAENKRHIYPHTDRRLATLIAVVLILLSGALGLVALPSAKAQNASTAPHLDSSGWTVFTPSADTRTIYVSSSTGNDSVSGLTQRAPVKTLKRGLSLMRPGYPDWLLLKKGDTWTDESIGYIQRSGRSATEPMLFSSYGTGARPIVAVSSSAQNNVGIGTLSVGGDFIAVTGIDFYAYKRDPDNPNFSQKEASSESTGAYWPRGPITWLLIEDCRFRFFKDNILIQPDPLKAENVYIRRNIIVDSYSLSSHSQGMFASFVSNLVIEENLFDHNGWNAKVKGADENMFNHNIYLSGVTKPRDPTSVPGPATIRGNIFSNDGSGSQIRSGGTVTNNLWVRNPYPHNIGMPSAANTSLVSDNVYLEANNPANNYQPLGNGPNVFSSYEGDAYNIGTVTFSNNIFAHRTAQSRGGYGLQLDSGSKGNIVTGNIFFNWPNNSHAVLDQGTGNRVSGNQIDLAGRNNNPGRNAPAEPFPDPTRSVGSYFATLGLGGTGQLADFLSAARLQSKDNWNAALTANAVNVYIRAGFGITPSATSR